MIPKNHNPTLCAFLLRNNLKALMFRMGRSGNASQYILPIL